ncbi:MAG: VacJ family lipoprotein [Azospirillaceae bacterium]
MNEDAFARIAPREAQRRSRGGRIILLALTASLIGACTQGGPAGGQEPPDNVSLAQASGDIPSAQDFAAPGADDGAAVVGAGDSVPHAETDFNDPLEDINRVIFDVNLAVDDYLIGPAAELYVAALPPEVREGVTNVLRNLNSPVIIGNQLLQGDLDGASDATARFLVNTTLGLGGVIDIANYNDGGIPYENEDFGQTLAVWGVPDGPYLVLPLLGPSNTRDTAGLIVDNLADPLTYVLADLDLEWLGYVRTGLSVLDARSRNDEAIDELRASSLDYYAALRAAYRQLRQLEINDQGGGGLGGRVILEGGLPEGYEPSGGSVPSADDFTFE